LSNPAIEAFAAQIQTEVIVAQVLLRPQGTGWELRHLDDRDSAASELRTVAIEGLRGLAQSTAWGAFRPLKSAPNLQRGWRSQANHLADLEAALSRLYPGFVADWYYVQTIGPQVTNYREFTERQTGMYRVTHGLTDQQASEAIRACCHRKFCLKQRFWTVATLAADSAEEKSLIPCFEPCAVMLEFARTAARVDQAEKVQLTRDDAESLAAGARNNSGTVRVDLREADFAAPDNPRRIQLALEKMESMLNNS